MMYKKLFKWEIFAGFALLLAIFAGTYAYFNSNLTRNIIDSELDLRLSITASAISSIVKEEIFQLNPDDINTILYKKYRKLMEKASADYGVNIMISDKNGRQLIKIPGDAYFPEIYNAEGISGDIAYFEKGYPVKYKINKQKNGYIVLASKNNNGQSMFDKAAKLQVISLIVLLGLSLLFSFIIAHFFTGRLSEDALRIKKIGEGERNLRLNVRWADELSYLESNINDMLDRLEILEKERKKEITTVAVGLAHEIKNPLTAAYTLSELAERNSDDQETKQKIRNIREELVRISDITGRFVHLLKDDMLNIEKIQISKFFERLKNIYTDVEFLSDSDFIMNVDALLFERVFKNLIKNSLEAEAAKIIVSAKKSIDGTIYIRVNDDAPQLSPDTEKMLFKPFVTNKPGGMGIGLSISKKIIEKHGGSIEYIREQTGNTFLIKMKGG